MDTFTITPAVNATQEFIEIANDFANPLDLVREAISNAYDAGASTVGITFIVEDDCGERTLVITISDDGKGMDRGGLQAFFDLGNSTKRHDPTSIGEKGHGTKIFITCASLSVVTTTSGGPTLTATVDAPYRTLNAGRIPSVHVTVADQAQPQAGTTITIRGYANNRRDRFTHQIVKDHIQWFTKVGSVEHVFRDPSRRMTVLLQGLGATKPERIPFGHVFPQPTKSLDDLLTDHVVRAPEWYCCRHVVSGRLPSMPEITFDVVFSIEGNRVKYGYNDMIRRNGYQAPEGAYTVADRYGLWFCKDFIPVQRRNDLINSKGYEHTKIHAFVNCQALKLTANRGSIDNTPAEILRELEICVAQVWGRIQASQDWINMAWLESEADGFRTVERERAQLIHRSKRVASSKTAVFLGATLIEPQRESGVVAILTQLEAIRPEVLPFTILDYDTHEGIDLLVKDNNQQSVAASRLYYVEVKHLLSSGFNHSFQNVHSIVCWDLDLKVGDCIRDITNTERKLTVAPDAQGHPAYHLDQHGSAHRIPVIVLSAWLKQRLGITFVPRTDVPTVI